jgi:hypothetical protein
LALVLKPQLEKMKMLIKKKKKMMMMEILLLFLLLMMIQTLAADAPTPCESREHGIFKLLKPRLLLLLAHTQVQPPTTNCSQIGSLQAIRLGRKKPNSRITCINSRASPRNLAGGGARLKQHQPWHLHILE